jgi:4'-phosphopantetheinyl transferase
MSSSSQFWSTPPANLAVGANEVHVWRISLEYPATGVESLWQILAPDERLRADRFHFSKDRQHFIIARGLLRTILGSYLDIKPERLRFGYESRGKPFLANSSAVESRLNFNLSHSHELALCAVTLKRQIGIDIERIRPDFASEEIAERFFSPHEIGALRKLPEHLRKEAFFHCWTRKEAFIKARGDGLSLPLDQFDVTLVPGEPARLQQVSWDQDEAARWSLQKIDAGPGYVGALAVEGDGWNSFFYLLA